MVIAIDSTSTNDQVRLEQWMLALKNFYVNLTIRTIIY